MGGNSKGFYGEVGQSRRGHIFDLHPSPAPGSEINLASIGNKILDRPTALLEQ